MRSVGLVLVLVFLGLALSCTDEGDDNQFREDVVWCEDALARLDTCCPGSDLSKVVCNHYRANFSCDGREEKTDPVLSSKESRCIRDTDCEALFVNKVCERAVEAGRINAVPSVSSEHVRNPGRSFEVCP